MRCLMEIIKKFRSFAEKEEITPIFKELIDQAVALLITNFEDKEQLKQQYSNLVIKEVVFTGTGFYCNFEPKTKCDPSVIYHETFGDVFGTINDEPIGFIMYFDNGKYISSLECYADYIENLNSRMKWDCIREILSFDIHKEK